MVHEIRTEGSSGARCTEDPRGRLVGQLKNIAAQRFPAILPGNARLAKITERKRSG